MKQVADACKQAAKQLDIPIEWGGDWKSFKDTPHIQLSAKKYPS
jgi:peptidoglycan L-alanyl-D-glutamate endopeptidase CwlK